MKMRQWGFIKRLHKACVAVRQDRLYRARRCHLQGFTCMDKNVDP